MAIQILKNFGTTEVSQLTKNSRLMWAFQNWQSRFSNFLSLITVFSPYLFWITLARSVERGISSPFRFSCSLLDIPPFFRNMRPPLDTNTGKYKILWWCSPLFFIPLSDISPFFRNMYTPPPPLHPLQENTRFYDDALESGRLKPINIKPLKPFTYGNSMETIWLKYWMCPDRYHSDN